MAAIHVHGPPDRATLLGYMREDARYDVADGRGTDACCITDADVVRDILDIKSGPAPPTVPKVMQCGGGCKFNCAYCGCRASRERDHEPYCNAPRDMAKIALDEAGRNRHGVFLTSAIYRSADYTQELIAETARVMREDMDYKGYLHCKVMPGADPALIERTGLYASRLSVNIEVAQSSGYEQIAKQKNRENILSPMGHISRLIRQHRERPGRFAVSQTTQLMAGSTNETDRTILTLADALYGKYRLKRVYYTAFGIREQVKGYDPITPVKTPYWRMSRLYQADRLLKLYNFTPEDIAPDASPFLQERLDPKAAWAIRNLHLFPVELSTADYEQLIRVPGIGIIYAKRILEARRHSRLTQAVLRQIGVSLKRCQYFVTADGRFLGGRAFDNDDRIACLLADDPLEQMKRCGQLSLF